MAAGGQLTRAEVKALPLADRPTLLYAIWFPDGAVYWGITYKILKERLGGHRQSFTPVGLRIGSGEEYEAEVVSRFPNRAEAEAAEKLAIAGSETAGVRVLNDHYSTYDDDDDCGCDCDCPEDEDGIVDDADCECYDDCECYEDDEFEDVYVDGIIASQYVRWKDRKPLETPTWGGTRYRGCFHRKRQRSVQ